MNFVNIYLVFITIVLLLLFVKNNKVETFTDNSLTESIENLGKIATSLVTNDNYTLPGSLTSEKMLSTTDLNIKRNLNILPEGSIIAYSGSTAPEGWGICDGKYYLKMKYRYDDNGKEINTNLIKESDKINTNINYYVKSPDLKDRFILGRDPVQHNINEAGGNDYITIHNLPEHSHSYDKGTSLSKGTGHVHATGSKSSHTISDFAIGINHTETQTGMWIHNNTSTKINQEKFYPKYYVLNYIIKL